MFDGYMTVAEVAKELGITAWAVRKHVAKGNIKANKFFPSVYLISKDEFERYKATTRYGGRDRKRSVA